MGTFGGHALPGSFFIGWAVWHIIQLNRRYYRSKGDNSKFKSSTWFPFECVCGRLKEWPLECIFKIVCVSIGIAGEIYTGMRQGVFRLPGNEQHATMFFFFGLTGVFEMLVYFRANLPPLIEYVSYVVAMCVEFILFRFHLHGRTPLDVLLHTLLLYVLVCTIVALLVEMKYPHSILAALTVRFFWLLQGTWFWQIGFILYNPVRGAEEWDGENHNQMMRATTYFTWHVGVNLIMVILTGTVVSCFYRRRADYGGSGGDTDALAMKRLIDDNANGQTFVNMNDDSDEDIEFEKAY